MRAQVKLHVQHCNGTRLEPSEPSKTSLTASYIDATLHATVILQQRLYKPTENNERVNQAVTSFVYNIKIIHFWSCSGFFFFWVK